MQPSNIAVKSARTRITPPREPDTQECTGGVSARCDSEEIQQHVQQTRRAPVSAGQRALVIGVGQIGSDLIPELVARGMEVAMMDLHPAEASPSAAHLDAKMPDWPDWRERWWPTDVTSPEAAARIAAYQPDVVYHLAALLSATGERKPDLAWAVNMDGTRAVMEALRSLQARDGRARRLILPSSIAVFGPLPDAPFPDPTPDDYPLMPTTMYGVTKVAGELLGAYYTRRGWLDYRGLRFPGLLNATPPGGGTTDYANLMYFAAAAGQPAVSAFVRPDTRLPFMYMPDAIRALIGLAEADPDRLRRRTYNVAAFSPTAEEIAGAIRRQGIDLDVSYVPDSRQQIADSWPSAIDDTSAQEDWDWAPAFDLDEMTAALLDELAR